MEKTPILKTLILENFRGFSREAVHFDNPTFLVGRNGSGKSNLLDALIFLTQAMVFTPSGLIGERGGIGAVVHRANSRRSPQDDPIFGLGVLLGPVDQVWSQARYAFQIEAKANGRFGCQIAREQCVIHTHAGDQIWFERTPEKSRTNVEGLSPQPVSDRLALPLLGSDARFAGLFRHLLSMRLCSITPNRVHGGSSPLYSDALDREGGNTASVLREIGQNRGEDMNRINEIMRTLLPVHKQVDVKEYGGRLELEFQQQHDDETEGWTLNALSMSDGTLRVLGLLATVYQNFAPTLLAVEEPEASIHPAALEIVLDVLRHASRRSQVLVTTHSPEILDADWIEDRHIRIVSAEHGETRVKSLSAGARGILKDHLMTAGEMLRSNALEEAQPDPSAGPIPLFMDLPS